MKKLLCAFELVGISLVLVAVYFPFYYEPLVILLFTVTFNLKLLGLASKTGILRRVVGSPETDGVEDLVRLAAALVASDVGYLHLFFHSSSLVPGNSPFVQTKQDAQALRACISEFVSRVSDFADLESATVSELARASA